jgi:hypothetical protein
MKTFAVSSQSRRSNVEKRNSRYWWQERQHKKQLKARRETGKPVASGGIKYDSIPTWKWGRTVQKYGRRIGNNY